MRRSVRGPGIPLDAGSCGLAWQPLTATPGLAWQPPAADTSYDIEIPQDVHTLSEEQIIERYGDELAQTLHVIDMQTHKCVTLVEDVVPWSINIDTMDDDAFPHRRSGARCYSCSS